MIPPGRIDESALTSQTCEHLPGVFDRFAHDDISDVNLLSRATGHGDDFAFSALWRAFCAAISGK
jgi:hypothetical protein